jgi:hypothetical protein
MEITLDLGKEPFELNFGNGIVETIYINPNDMNLPIRMKDFEKNMQSKMGNIEDFKISTNGEALEMIEEFKKLQDIMFEEIDYAFGSEISSKVFKYCSPFTVIDGEYFIVQFLRKLKPEIERRVKKSSAVTQKKMEKYLSKYKK